MSGLVSLDQFNRGYGWAYPTERGWLAPAFIMIWQARVMNCTANFVGLEHCEHCQKEHSHEVSNSRLCSELTLLRGLGWPLLSFMAWRARVSDSTAESRRTRALLALLGLTR